MSGSEDLVLLTENRWINLPPWRETRAP